MARAWRSSRPSGEVSSRVVVCPAGRHGVGADAGSGVKRLPDEPPGVVRSTDEGPHIPDAVAEVIAVPGYAACLRFTFQDNDVERRVAGQACRGS